MEPVTNTSAAPTRGGKFKWLLMLQAWAMLWVVIGHSPLYEFDYASPIDWVSKDIAQALWTFAYSFHMTLFIMISGYLFHRTRISRNVAYGWMMKEKLTRLGIPFVVFTTLALIVKICYNGGGMRSIDLTPIGLLNCYLRPYDGPLREMWFIAVILLYFAIYPVYRHILKSRVATVAVLFLAIGMAFINQDCGITTLFAIDRALPRFIAFYVGILISAYSLNDRISSSRGISITAAVVVGSYLLDFSLGLRIALSLLFWGCALRIERRGVTNLFSSFRDYTYQIFMMGIFVQLFVKIIFRTFYFPGSYPLFFVLCAVAALYVPAWISRWIERSHNRVLGLACGLKVSK